MRYQLFQYPLPAPPELEDLNAFLASNRVAAVTQYLAQGPASASLIFVVETPTGPHKPATATSPRLDYREILSPEEFAIFGRLRTERKRAADADGVPVYTVFTNAQLAEMVKRRVRTAGDLAAIDGVGSARVAKYGDRLLHCLADLASEASTAAPSVTADGDEPR